MSELNDIRGAFLCVCCDYWDFSFAMNIVLKFR